MDDFFDRLDKYMKYSGLNDNQLTVLAQLSVGTLGKQRKGGRGLSVESIAKILRACSNLNAEWLLTGAGEMLKAKHVDVNPTKDSVKEPTIDSTVGLILSRDERLIRENERLLMKIDELERKISSNGSAQYSD